MKDKPFRLALRAEGSLWKCYIAGMDSMENAIFIGSILLRVTEENPEIKAQFMQVMKDSVTYVLEQTIGIPIKEWGEPTPAPEKDRRKPS